MRIGFLQMAPMLADRQATLKHIDQLLDGKELPDLLVLPELCNSGYNFRSTEQARQTAEVIEKSPFVEHLQNLCAKSRCHIVSGINELFAGKLYNSAVLIGSDGPIGTYRKMHLFLNEKDTFQPGDLGFPIFEIAGYRLGILICFDWIFPESWRVLALKGADIICHPSNLVLPTLAQRGVPIHAMVNSVYTITANRTGREGDLSYTGCSIIADPRGETICSAGSDDQDLYVVEIDVAKARDKKITARNDLFADRRPEEYGELTAQ